MSNKQSKFSFSDPLLWGIFILYIIVLGYTTAHHELWGDELHSWNIAKASGGFSGLIYNTRYEGHPPLWYCILWFVSKITHDVTAIQYVQFVLAGLSVFLILFFSPFSLLTRILIPFGYFFLFEYGVISRNYAIGVLLALCICIVLLKNFKYKSLIYYFLLFLLSNTHLLALLLAMSLHLYFLLWQREQGRRKYLLLHALAGIIILLPAVYFIFPPSDSSLDTDFWLQRWKMEQLTVIVKTPVSAFIPVPDWWNYHFWNTEFLLEAQNKWAFLKWFILVISSGLILLPVFALKKNKKSLTFFLFYLGLILIASTIIPFANARQVGFLYVGFLVAYWLYGFQNIPGRTEQRIVFGLLFIQMIAGIFAVSKEIRYPFSNNFHVRELLSQIPAGNKPVTDYWCLNTLSAFTDKAFYCIDLQKETSFLLWNQEMAEVVKAENPYSDGLKNLFKKQGINQIFMITIHSPEKIFRRDTLLFTLFRVDLVDKKEGAIEKSSNLYLYRISQK